MTNTNNIEHNDLLQMASFTTTTSAYASAESSPRDNLTPSQSANSLTNFNTTETTDVYKSASSSANNSFNDLAEQASSNSTLSSTSASSSVIAVKSEEMTSLNHMQREYQSLPHFSDANSSSKKRDELEEKPNVKQIISDTISTSLGEKQVCEISSTFAS